MNADMAWGILIGAVGMVGLEAIAFIVLLIVGVRRQYAQRQTAAKPPGLRVVDTD